MFYWYKTPRGGPAIDKNSIFYASLNAIDGMLLVHNGYSFGGSVGNENFNSKNFQIYPHDCAEYVNYIIGSLNKDKFSNKYSIMWTADMHNFNNFILQKDFISYDAIRENLQAYAAFAQNVNPVRLQNIHDIKEGDILVFRKFSKDKTKDNSNGVAGHVGIVLGTDANDKIYIISYARNYEEFNTGGALISALSFKNITNNLYATTLFRHKEQDYDQSSDNIINVSLKSGQCILSYKDKSYKCVIGKNGLGKTAEGDNKTPVGIFDISEVFYRKDKLSNLITKLPTIPIERGYAWCDVSASEDYNKFTLLSSPRCRGTTENLYRDDNLYDIIVPIEYNKNGIPKKGSAIFLHVAREGYSPTSGCVCMAKEDLVSLLSEINTKTKIKIHDFAKK
jgi:L,D-peptidoglycan transpeptidase YkuD (ErfK/YbiS/YcfS/YnhG family)